MMYTNLNPRTTGLNHHLYEGLLAAAGKCGSGGIEVPTHAFGSMEEARRAGKVLESRGMKQGLMMGPCDMFRAGDEEFDKALGQWAKWLERTRAAGCNRAYNHFWPGADEHDFEENFEWYRNHLQRTYHIMKENGFQYGLGFMGARTVCSKFRYPFIRTISGTMALAGSVSREIGFVFDCIHWYTSGVRKDNLYLYLNNVERVADLHLDDAYPGGGPDQQEDRERAMPSQWGVINSTAIVRAFHKRGCEGPVIVEPMAPTTERYETMKLEEVVREAALCLNGILQEAGIFV